MQADGAHSPGPDKEAVLWMIEERDVLGFGTECVGTDAGQAFAMDPPYPCHHFMHGNGRLGRMFIPLFLHTAGLIRAPMFYISAYFERQRAEYYARLAAVSSDEDWTGWCEFFLKAVIDQAEENQSKAACILKLYEDKKRQLVDLTHSQYAIHALDFFFSRPVFNATDFTSAKDIPAATAKRILVLLRDSGMLKTVRGAKGRRPAVYAFLELIDVAEGRVSR
jgi:Fic family protein